MNRLGKFIFIVVVLAGLAFAALIAVGSFQPRPSRRAALGVPADGSARPAPPAATVMPSGLAIPVAGVAPGALADSFGDARGGGARGHGALDIMAPTGTPVLAAAGGTVEKLFESEDGGHTLYVRSPDGRFVYYYAHLDAYAPDVSEGMYVAQGRQIATVGSTGDADPAGPHLHFEIKRMAARQKWYDGEAVNPYPLLAGEAAPR